MIGDYEARRLADAIAGAGRQEARGGTVAGQVVGTDGDGTVWVQVVGGAEATPIAASTAEYGEGDVIDVTIQGGSAIGRGNYTDPAARASSVREAMGVAVQARDGIESAKEAAAAAERAAEEAAEVARVTSQHFWDDDGGAHVTDVTRDEWEQAEAAGFPDLSDQKPYHNALWNSLGMLFRRALNNLVSITRSAIAFFDGEGNGAGSIVARFGKDGFQVGRNGESRLVGDYHSLRLLDKDDFAYFYVSDARDREGKAELHAYWYYNGTNTFLLSPGAATADYTVKVDGAERTTFIVKRLGSFTLEDDPSAPIQSKALIECDYTTTALAAAMTFGSRATQPNLWGDPPNIGSTSCSIGADTIASGSGSLSQGFQTAAVGGFSHAAGYMTRALGTGSHAEGFRTVAKGDYSHAEGGGTAEGKHSHAEGSSSEALGDYSHAEGIAIAKGNYSHAEGEITEAVGEGSHAEGRGAKALGAASHAEGRGTAEGEHSHAEGGGTAEGDYSHAEGSSTASGYRAHAEGGGEAKGEYSHAEGGGIANGEASHAEGGGTADGVVSHAEGLSTVAGGDYSHSQNFYTSAMSDCQTAIGRCNIPDEVGAYALIIGNGADRDNRSNAFTVDWGGNMEAAGDVSDGSGNVLSDKADASALSGYALKAGANVYTDSQSIKDPDIDRDAASPAQRQDGKALILRDKNSETIGRVRCQRYTDGRIAIQVIATNEKADGSEVHNSLSILVAKDGTATYSVGSQPNFRNALGASGGTWQVAHGGTGSTGVATTTTLADIIAAESGVTISDVQFAQWGKVAQLRFGVTPSAAKSGVWDVGTIVSGKRPAAVAYGNVWSTSFISFAVGASGKVQANGQLNAGSKMMVSFFFLLA